MNKPTLLLPIAGKAQRFKDAGIDIPKPMIKVCGKSIIEWSLMSIKDLDAYKIVFVVQQQDCSDWGLHAELMRLYGTHIEILMLDEYTGGTLETCMKAEPNGNKDMPLVVFTSDALFKPAFDIDTMLYHNEGLLSLYPSTKPSCSYARIIGNSIVQIAEKKVISPYATTGLYYFKYAYEFFNMAQVMIDENDRVNGEFYIAPLYNRLIRAGQNIGYQMVETVHVLGTPEELKEFEKCSMS